MASVWTALRKLRRSALAVASSATLFATLCAAALPALAGGEPRAAPFGAWVQAAGLAGSQVGAIALPLDGGPPLVAHEADRPLNPASAIKLLTTYAGLALLGSEYRWRTEARLRGELSGGVLRGDLVLRGGGDPKLVIEDLEAFVARMRAAGLERIDGDLVVDDAIFDSDGRSVEDFDGDPSQPYNVRPFGALMNFKAARVVVRPRSKGAEVAFDPALADVAVDNRIRVVGGACRFGAAQLQLRDAGRAEAPVLRVSGRYSRACGEQGVFAALLDHRQFVHGLFKAAWEAAGGRLVGGTRIERGAARGEPWLVWESPRTLAEVVRDINKFSNNVMTRQLLLQLAAEAGARPASAESARRVLRDWLAAQGLDHPRLVVDNGAGLSREARISAVHLAQVLRHAAAGPHADALRESLPVVGIDGTMKARLAGEPVAGNAWIKTGSLEAVRSIAGYVQAASGRRYAVVLLVNGPDAGASRSLQDEFLRWVHASG